MVDDVAHGNRIVVLIKIGSPVCGILGGGASRNIFALVSDGPVCKHNLLEGIVCGNFS